MLWPIFSTNIRLTCQCCHSWHKILYVWPCVQSVGAICERRSLRESDINSLAGQAGFAKFIFAQRYCGCGHWVCCQQTSSRFKAHTKKDFWQRFLFSESWYQDIPHFCCQEALMKSASQVRTGEELDMPWLHPLEIYRCLKIVTDVNNGHGFQDGQSRWQYQDGFTERSTS